MSGFVAFAGQPSGVRTAWVVGSEPAVVVDFQGMVDYARTAQAHA